MPSKWRLRNVTWVQLLKLTCHEAGFERADFQVKSGSGGPLENTSLCKYAAIDKF